jgi:hypothetical protein
MFRFGQFAASPPAFDTAIMPAGTPTAYFELKRFSLIRACFSTRLDAYYPLSRVFCLLPFSGAHRLIWRWWGCCHRTAESAERPNGGLERFDILKLPLAKSSICESLLFPAEKPHPFRSPSH